MLLICDAFYYLFKKSTSKNQFYETQFEKYSCKGFLKTNKIDF